MSSSKNMSGRAKPWAFMALAGMVGGMLIWALWPQAGTHGAAQAPPALDPPSLLVATPASGPPVQAMASISAAELARQYLDSRTMVDGQYRHRWLRLTGQVESVESSEAGVTLVSLAAGEDLPPLGVVMASSEQSLVRPWRPGDAVALRCLHHGLLMGRPVLAECRVTESR